MHKIFAAALLASAATAIASAPASATYSSPIPLLSGHEYPTAEKACRAENDGNPAFVYHWAVKLADGAWVSMFNGMDPLPGQLNGANTWANVSASTTMSPNNYKITGLDDRAKFGMNATFILRCPTAE